MEFMYVLASSAGGNIQYVQQTTVVHTVQGLADALAAVWCALDLAAAQTVALCCPRCTSVLNTVFTLYTITGFRPAELQISPVVRTSLPLGKIQLSEETPSCSAGHLKVLLSLLL